MSFRTAREISGCVSDTSESRTNDGLKFWRVPVSSARRRPIRRTAADDYHNPLPPLFCNTWRKLSFIYSSSHACCICHNFIIHLQQRNFCIVFNCCRCKFLKIMIKCKCHKTMFKRIKLFRYKRYLIIDYFSSIIRYYSYFICNSKYVAFVWSSK